MKIIKSIFLVVLLIGVFISCNKANEKQVENKIEKIKELPMKLESFEIKIEGMTCEIGCARLIQSKLHKTEGVEFVEISFEEKNGKITFDTNKVTYTDIKNIIEKIAGGDVYSVIQMNKVRKFSK
ncbi:MAG: cation transporter [Flavobacteriaceae bacterium]|nr:cation transporter [Flavobacteriaceae bacterium]